MPKPLPQQYLEDAFDVDTLKSLCPEASPADAETIPETDLEDLLQEMTGLSLITWKSDNAAFSVHTVLKDFIWSQLGSDEQRQAALQGTLAWINRAIPSDPPAR